MYKNMVDKGERMIRRPSFYKTYYYGYETQTWTRSSRKKSHSGAKILMKSQLNFYYNFKFSNDVAALNEFSQILKWNEK